MSSQQRNRRKGKLYGKRKVSGEGYSKKKAPVKMKTPQKGSNSELIRLNKYIANSGICSRREADDHIAIGLVTVNGKVVTEMGYKVKPGDEVRYDGSHITPEK